MSSMLLAHTHGSLRAHIVDSKCRGCTLDNLMGMYREETAIRAASGSMHTLASRVKGPLKTCGIFTEDELIRRFRDRRVSGGDPLRERSIPRKAS